MREVCVLQELMSGNHGFTAHKLLTFHKEVLWVGLQYMLYEDVCVVCCERRCVFYERGMCILYIFYKESVL